MSDNKLAIKIQAPETIIERREMGAEKRMKADSEYTIPGWRVLGVPYGGHIQGRDTDGEAFHPGTDIWLKVGDHVNLTYYHGFDAEDPGKPQETPAMIGRAIYTGKDDRGHWFEPMLDESEPLAQRLLSAGVENLRASSGAVSHLVRKSAGGLIDVWPVGELALFDTNEWRKPANELAVIELKSESITEAIPEVVETTVDAVEDEMEAKKSNTIISQFPMEEKMDEEKTVEKEQAPVDEPKVDVKALADEIRKSVIEELKAEPGIERGKKTAKAPATIDSLGEADYTKAFWHYIKTGETSDLRKAIKLNAVPLNEGTPAQGGYLVPDDEYGRIVAKRDEESIISRLGLLRVTTDRDKYNFPVEATSLSRFTIVAEEGPISAAEDEPVFGQEPITIYNFKKLIKVSEEILEDENSGLEMFLNDAIGRALADTENYYALVGAGTTEPEGAFVGGTPGLTLLDDVTISPSEISTLMGKLGSPYHNGAVWVMNPATWFYLKGIQGNQFVFTDGVARMSGTVDGPTLEGYPVVLNSNVPSYAVASNKSLLFGNFNYMGFVTNRGLRIRRLNELYAGTGQVGILVNYRFGCGVLQAEAFQYATQAV